LSRLLRQPAGLVGGPDLDLAGLRLLLQRDADLRDAALVVGHDLLRVTPRSTVTSRLLVSTPDRSKRSSIS
jgi:hypothetical protein